MESRVGVEIFFNVFLKKILPDLDRMKRLHLVAKKQHCNL